MLHSCVHMFEDVGDGIFYTYDKRVLDRHWCAIHSNQLFTRQKSMIDILHGWISQYPTILRAFTTWVMYDSELSYDASKIPYYIKNKSFDL